MTTKFNVKFPLFEKIEVNGPMTHPLYVYLRNNSELFDKNSNSSKLIPWNFAKFVVDRKGKVIAFFQPSEELEEVRRIIEKELLYWRSIQNTNE